MQVRLVEKYGSLLDFDIGSPQSEVKIKAPISVYIVLK